MDMKKLMWLIGTLRKHRNMDINNILGQRVQAKAHVVRIRTN